MNRRARAADRLASGSAVLVRRLGARTAAWVARGRRDDLTGWRAALGCWLRLAVLALGLYALWRLVRAVPNLLWLLSACWTAAAWRAGKAASPPAAKEALVDSAPDHDRQVLQQLLLDLMGDADAVHLRTVLAHLQGQGHGEGWSVGDLRARLEALSIPTHPKVKAPGSKSPTRGVRRVDLAPSPDEPQESSPEPSTAA
ncbi:hypothetical protein ABT063_24725 [Streptomyces sp. NPDC002838]|uniref:hypothetical protein n=1 Tax=Streptomyces sp. NPDC002838 TaxID=3154436 RepID=UPI0033317062